MVFFILRVEDFNHFSSLVFHFDYFIEIQSNTCSMLCSFESCRKILHSLSWVFVSFFRFLQCYFLKYSVLVFGRADIAVFLYFTLGCRFTCCCCNATMMGSWKVFLGFVNSKSKFSWEEQEEGVHPVHAKIFCFGCLFWEERYSSCLRC